MKDIPFIVQLALLQIMSKDGITMWWEHPMHWPNGSLASPEAMWVIDPMQVIDRLESYLEPQVFT